MEMSPPRRFASLVRQDTSPARSEESLHAMTHVNRAHFRLPVRPTVVLALLEVIQSLRLSHARLVLQDTFPSSVEKQTAVVVRVDQDRTRLQVRRTVASVQPEDLKTETLHRHAKRVLPVTCQI